MKPRPENDCKHCYRMVTREDGTRVLKCMHCPKEVA
jgi:hypothetical protein